MLVGLIDTVHELRPDFGKVLAIDSTGVPAYCNPNNETTRDKEAAWGVTADIKVCKIAEMELTHPMAMASSADSLRRCFRQRAKGGSSERDLRTERRGPFDPGDRPGVGRVTQYGEEIPEVAGGHATETAQTTGVQAGPVHRVHRPADGRRAGKLRGAAPGVGGSGI